jgi:hypothetical protein
MVCFLTFFLRFFEISLLIGMNIEGVSRPRQNIGKFEDNEPRSKCSLCCALRNSAFVFGCVWISQVPIACAIFGFRNVFASKVALLDYTCLIPLPISLAAFTHQHLLSESLWSKNRKTVFECNVETIVMNVVGWCAVVGACTYVSRNILVKKNTTYRMLQWDYRRKMQTSPNKYAPSFFGTVSLDLDWYTFLWFAWGYHLGWVGVTIFLEKQQGAHYAMLYRSTSFSKRCSPRWREWREHKVRDEIAVTHKVASGRWGNIISGEMWRGRGVQ